MQNGRDRSVGWENGAGRAGSLDSVEFSKLLCFFCILIFIFCPSRHLVCDRRQVRITSPWCMSPALGTCHRLLVIVTSPCYKTTASSAPGVFFLSSRPLNGSARNGSPEMADWRSPDGSPLDSSPWNRSPSDSPVGGGA